MPKRALLSVSDKTGIVDFARRLVAAGYQIISTGGTAKALIDAKIVVTPVEDVTKFPECFSGRVKTMHPMIMGGLLFRRDDAEHQKEAKKLGIEPIDLVCVNLYPFESEQTIEQIDIGGPALLRSAAKNHASVTVVCDPADYDRVIGEIEANGDTTPDTRKELAAKVFLRTAAYDAAITEYLSGGANTGIMLTGGRQLRYGENPHQWGKYYATYSPQISPVETRESRVSTGGTTAPTWGEVLQGKELSYLNILDADATWDAVQEFTEPTAVFVKHANPSGIASHPEINEAFQRAYDADRLSAFGVVIAVNRPFTKTMAQKIIDQKMFVEVIVAPEYEAAALDVLKQKPNIRVIRQQNGDALRDRTMYRSVLGGMLVQNRDNKIVTESDLTCVTEKQPTPEQIADLLFAWKSVKHAKSNAIVLAKDLVTIGIGSGQTSRVDATWIALKRAGDKANGAVLASDAFFPFPDALIEAAKGGIAAVIQPGGSVKDAEVIAKANELEIAMVVTGVRAFRH
ncbi:MAG: phosphoribosylaminoimidazolecarboxamide formyltransferase / IMP cyclohydrolase [Candidatus Peregrinibacteria bacterium Greene0416_19]|nr:MAG: phosphoribosylaminoimidazolecarboxamide formyltransferase / IMP cyclohydrolase [Candidatus Peregrinibacteria bacterium Greene0416_19]